MPSIDPAPTPPRQTSAGAALLPLLVGALLGGCAPRTVPRAQVEGTTRWVSLPSGMRVVVEEDHAAPAVALQLWIQAGSGDDPRGASGMSHLLEHLVLRSPGAVAEVEALGGRTEVGTTIDLTWFKEQVPSRFFDDRLVRLARRLNLPITAAALQNKRTAVQRAIWRGQRNPDRVALDQLLAASFGAQPYGRPVSGRVEEVARITLQAARAFRRRRWTPAAMTLVVVGDVDRRAVLAKIQRLFRQPRRATQPRHREAPPPAPRPAPRILVRRGEGARVVLGFHLPARDDRAMDALELAAAILGQGRSSRIARLVAGEGSPLERGRAFVHAPQGSGLLVLSGVPARRELVQATTALVREALTLAAHGPTHEELQRAQKDVLSSMIWQRETFTGRAHQIGFHTSMRSSVSTIRERRRRLAQISADRVRAAARRSLRPERMTLVAVTGAADADHERLKPALAAAVVRAAAPRRQASAGVKRSIDGDLLKVTLANGARLLLRRDRTVPLAAFHAAFSGGLRSEDRVSNGATRLLAALLESELRASVARITPAGAAPAVGSAAGRDRVDLQLQLPARDWRSGMQSLAGALRAPWRAPTDRLARLRRAQLDRILERAADPAAAAAALFRRALYRRHPYRLEPLGTVASLASLGPAQLRRHHGRCLCPAAVVLAIVGDVPVEPVVASFEQLFGGAPPCRELRVPLEPARGPGGEPVAEAVAFAAGKTAHLVVGYGGTSSKSSDRYALEVVAELLNARLSRLREQGLVMRASVRLHLGIEPGSVAIQVEVAPAQLRRVAAAIEAQVRALQRPLLPAEVERAKRRLAGRFELSLQRRAVSAARLADFECCGAGYRRYARHAERILGVSAGQLQRAARRYLAAGRRVTALVTPREASPGARELFGAPVSRAR
jgi:zinc protease